jgi:excinuclease ABC subunit B
LIQTVGRAARNIHGKAVLYADAMTDSMRRAIDETDRRRTLQRKYNEEHGITPASIVKAIDDVMSSVYERDYSAAPSPRETRPAFRTQAELDAEIARVEQDMKAAAANLDFERAASLRDSLKSLRSRELGFGSAAGR